MLVVILYKNTISVSFIFFTASFFPTILSIRWSIICFPVSATFTIPRSAGGSESEWEDAGLYVIRYPVALQQDDALTAGHRPARFIYVYRASSRWPADRDGWLLSRQWVRREVFGHHQNANSQASAVWGSATSPLILAFTGAGTRNCLTNLLSGCQYLVTAGETVQR